MESKPSIKGEFPKVNSVPATSPPHLIFPGYLWWLKIFQGRTSNLSVPIVFYEMMTSAVPVMRV